MRAVIQRVETASVSVQGQVVGRIQNGLLVLLGVEEGDGAPDLAYMRRKIVNLRVFEDDAGRMNRSVVDARGSVLLVSQFTLLGNTRHGNRPDFTRAAPPAEAQRLYEALAGAIREDGVAVECGVFQAMMKVSLVNDGPVTVLLDSRKEY